ncbi:hypothetical protein AN958_09259 [Leucoagaricus sp. SymC.cos]|nr:hypothetical protein AN958_09259 [Leucoagaricus sp. SymC.cos]
MTCSGCRLNETVLLTCVCSPRSKLNVDLNSDSHAHRHLHTNHHPHTTSDLTSVYSLLQTAETSLTTLDSDIAHVQLILSNLFTQRAALQHTIASHKSLLAPIRRLPNELLAEIFLSRESSSPGGVNNASKSTVSFTNIHNDTLWTILQVSSLWRSIAQSTPRLWNTLLIDLTCLKGKRCLYKLFQTRLSKCLLHYLPGGLPLNFAITGTHYQDSSFILPLVTTLCNYSDRWGKVYFCPYTTNILASQKLDDKFRSFDSMMNMLAMGLASFNPVPGFIQTPTQLGYTPKLRKLALHDYRADPNFVLPSFCSQLTHLYLDSCSYYTCPDMLSYLPSLVYLEIFNKHQLSTRSPAFSSTTTGSTSSNTATVSGPNIHLPNLQILKATGWLTNLCFFLPQLDLPAIKKIGILALAEHCHPCTCAVVKMRIVNEWVETMATKRHVQVTVNHSTSYDLKTSMDEGIVAFLFGANAD